MYLNLAVVLLLLVEVALGRSAETTLNERVDSIDESLHGEDGANANSEDHFPSCSQAELLLQDLESVFNELSLVVHRNGEPEPCGIAPLSTDSIVNALQSLDACDNDPFNKYDTEAFLTTLLIHQLQTEGECGSQDNTTAPEGLVGFCDMGPARTTIQADHKYLVRVPGGSLPCRFYTRDGAHVDSLDSLAALAEQAKEDFESCSENEGETCSSGPALNLFAVPAGRVFMFAPSFVGEKIVLDRMRDSAPGREPIVVEVLSLKPRAFELHNFFSVEEADIIIEQALNESSESHKFHRSTTGAVNGQVISTRTSENAWLTGTADALKIKKRCLEVLGFDEYKESHTDGLQVLRYQNNQAYAVHPDYLSVRGGKENYDYDTSGVGGNRFATVLLYMSDVESGGETVFDHAYPHDATPEQIATPQSDTIRMLRESGELGFIKEGSWEERLTATCQTHLAIKPKRGRAVLFYSQHPNGVHDEYANHGACPVIKGTKWAANLWVWNAPRQEFEYAPRKRPEERAPRPVHTQLLAEFHNTGADPSLNDAMLYYEEDTSFGKLGPNDPPIRVNTYEGHVWNVKVDGKIQQSFKITSEPHQKFDV